LFVYLGGLKGKYARKFTSPNKYKSIGPIMKDPQNWVSVGKIDMPYVLQTWQKKQKSTVIYPNPIKFAIA
jgi:hypothetical protein